MRGPLLMSALLVVGALGCGGGSSGDDEIPSFGGPWGVSYKRVVDECELFPQGSDTIDDTQVVTQNGTAVRITSDAFDQSFSGTTRGSDSFLGEARESQQFQSGIQCEVHEELAYNDLDGDEAENLYRVQILCPGGSRCESVARGTARRR